jgi:site-specific recombinase
MLALLERIAANPDTNSIDDLTAIMQKLRPTKPHQLEQASSNIRTFTQLLQGKRSHAIALRHYLLHVFSTRHQTKLYTDTGILSSKGFFSELFQRITYRILPPAVSDHCLRDCLDSVLPYKTDYLWMAGVPVADWLALFDALANAGETERDAPYNKIMITHLMEAIQILSCRISAMGLEPDLIRNNPDLETFSSQFLIQNVEIQRYLCGYASYLNGDPAPFANANNLLPMLDQCDSLVGNIRQNAMIYGTSVALTYLLVRLNQSIARLRKLLLLIDVSQNSRGSSRLGNGDESTEPSSRISAGLALGLEFIKTHKRKYAIRELLASNINLLARNVTENASRTGERYLTKNRREYFSMFRSAAGAGFIVGILAVLTIFIHHLHAAPLVEAFLLSLNYSVGLILIHVLHFSVATKQPAMTASRIAAELHSRDGRNIDLDSLVELITKVARTQFVAVFGNLIMAFPITYLLAWGYFALEGQHLVSAEKAGLMLNDINPLHSLALFYAAITGVCLFVVGLISGYYDNKSVYANVRVRIEQLHWLQRLLGKKRQLKFAAYMESNLGGLMGSLNFGIMLGSIGTLGYMLGLPIDIRQITFSAANFALSLFSLENKTNWQTLVTATFGVLSIGIINLLVSFSLALFVALRSRQVRFNKWLTLIKALLMHFIKSPLDFFIQPKKQVRENPLIGCIDLTGIWKVSIDVESTSIRWK